MKKFILPLVLIGLVSCSQDSIDPSEKNSEDLQRDYVITKAQPFEFKMVEAITRRVEDPKIEVVKSEKNSEDLQRDYVIAKAQPFEFKMVEATTRRVEDPKSK